MNVYAAQFKESFNDKLLKTAVLEFTEEYEIFYDFYTLQFSKSISNNMCNINHLIIKLLSCKRTSEALSNYATRNILI